MDNHTVQLIEENAKQKEIISQLQERVFYQHQKIQDLMRARLSIKGVIKMHSTGCNQILQIKDIQSTPDGVVIEVT